MLQKFIKSPAGYALTGGTIAMGIYEAVRTESKTEGISWAFMAGVLATVAALGAYIDHLRVQKGLEAAPALEP